MYNEYTAFNQHCLRVSLARQEWLNQWKLFESQALQCPRCASTLISLLSSHKNLKTHQCKECKFDFSMNDVPGCDCTFPGILPKCYDCNHYKNMERYIEKRLPDLRLLSDAEVESRYNPANYRLRDMKRYPVQQETELETNQWPEDWNTEWKQIELFDFPSSNETQ